MNAIRRLCYFSFVIMTAFFLTVILVFNLTANAVQFVDLGQSTKGRLNEECGRAFGQGIADALNQEAQYQRQIRYQREMMEMLREQIRWEMENAR